MKTKNLIKVALILVTVAGISFTSCKKDKSNDNTKSMQQLATDENDIQTASDDAINDANDILSKSPAKSLDLLPCGATVD